MSPELAMSAILVGVASWLALLARRAPTAHLAWAALFLISPAITLAIQAAGVSPEVIEGSKLAGVAASAVLALWMVAATWSPVSPASRALAARDDEREVAEVAALRAVSETHRQATHALAGPLLRLVERIEAGDDHGS